MDVSTEVVSDPNGVTVCEETMAVRIPAGLLGGEVDHVMKLALLHDERDIEPIFSGAAWAGSVLWAAAQVLTEELLLKGATPVKGSSVLELGCGLGIPGFIAALCGAREVVLTEQPSLIPLLARNVEENFPAGADDAVTAARPDPVELSWGTEETERFLAARRAARGELFDYILICDCVFVPLYGDSWELLCETLRVLCPLGSATAALIACERRCDDGIPDFLANLARDFDLTVHWNSYADDELATLLESSHIGAARKPIRIYKAVRVAAASEEGSLGPATAVPISWSSALTSVDAAALAIGGGGGEVAVVGAAPKDGPGDSPEGSGWQGAAEGSACGDNGDVRDGTFSVGEATEGHQDPPMLKAARDGDAARVVQLLASGQVADPDALLPYPSATAGLIATDSRGGGGGSGSEGCTALWWAAWSGHAEVVDALLEAGADVDAPSAPPRQGTLEEGGEPQPQLPPLPPPLPGDETRRRGRGVTPLMAASAARHQEIVEQLVAWGADASIKDSEGRTALDCAADAEREDAQRQRQGGVPVPAGSGNHGSRDV